MRRRHRTGSDLPRWARWSYTSEWWSSREAHDAALAGSDWRVFAYYAALSRVFTAIDITYGPDWDSRRGVRLWPRGLEIYYPLVPPDEPRGGERPWPPPPGGPPAELVAAVEAEVARSEAMKRAIRRGERAETAVS
jgi:hypothetical protein